MVFEGDFVGGVITGETNAEDRRRTPTSSRSRRSTDREPAVLAAATSPSLLDDTRRQGADRVPGLAGGGRDLGGRGRVHLAEQAGRRRRPTPTTCHARAAQALIAAGDNVRFDMSDLAHGVRRHDRPGQVEDPAGLPPEPRRRRRHGPGAGEAAAQGLRRTEATPACTVASTAGRHARRQRGSRGGAAAVPRARARAARRARRLPDRLLGRPQLLRRQRHQLRRPRQLPGDVHGRRHPHRDQEQPDLGGGRADRRHRARPDLRGAHRAGRAGARRSSCASSCRWRSRSWRPASSSGWSTNRTPRSGVANARSARVARRVRRAGRASRGARPSRTRRRSNRRRTAPCETAGTGRRRATPRCSAWSAIPPEAVPADAVHGGRAHGADGGGHRHRLAGLHAGRRRRARA